jgi:hypothetical protein
MAREQRTIDVYWTVQGGQRFTISLTEKAAWDSLNNLWAYDEDPHGWTIERATEVVPVAFGEVCEGQGEALELDDVGREESRVPYTPVKVFWTCPRCEEQHSTDRYDHPIDRSSPAANPSLWFCERGEGLVLVGW